ncbi:MAG: hypothetical protein V4857_01740 [Pseudomonadota bacterium]
MNTASLYTLADRELSVRARFGYVALLLAALTMSALVGALLLTEPALKPRTELALAVLTFIGMCWVGFAVWVLSFRRVLLAYQDIVAARMALAFCAVALAGALFLALGEGSEAAAAAAPVFGAMLVLAVALLVRARRRLKALLARRAELEGRLRG